MRVLVVGATGVLGRQVIPRLLEHGHEVRAIVRGPNDVQRLRRIGVDALLGDILEPLTLGPAAEGCDAALHLATAIPRPGPRQDWSLNDRIRRDGTRHLLAAAARSGVRRYVQQSITLLYGNRGTEIVDEGAEVQPAPRLQSAVDMETLVRASGLDWVIARGGSFYGPGTGREERWRQEARAGSLRWPDDGATLASLVHTVDMAGAVVAATERASSGSTYNVVDDEPVSYRDLYRYVAAGVDGPEPGPGGEANLSSGCSNARLRADLGWSPAYPSYRSGLA